VRELASVAADPRSGKKGLNLDRVESMAAEKGEPHEGKSQ